MVSRKTSADKPASNERSRAKRAKKAAAADAALPKPARRTGRSSAPPPPGPELASAIAALREIAERLTSSWSGVARSIEELPRVSDLQPLADHLYEFAQTAPALLESLRQLPAAVAPVAAATGTLTEIAERLDGAQSRLNDALFRLPRPSEYEPLAEPLREFARVSPSLVEALGGLPRVTAALEGLMRRVEATAERLEARAAAQDAPASSSPSLTAVAASGATAGLLAMRLSRIGEALNHAREELRLALASLPAPADYGPAARQLREIASVSPTLLAWLEQEVPKLAAPLSESVAALRAAAQALDGALVDVEIARRDLTGGEA